jgi:hypothetical protein
LEWLSLGTTKQLAEKSFKTENHNSDKTCVAPLGLISYLIDSQHLRAGLNNFAPAGAGSFKLQSMLRSRRSHTAVKGNHKGFEKAPFNRCTAATRMNTGCFRQRFVNT